jgi:hypothetical protein
VEDGAPLFVIAVCALAALPLGAVFWRSRRSPFYAVPTTWPIGVAVVAWIFPYPITRDHLVAAVFLATVGASCTALFVSYLRWIGRRIDDLQRAAPLE